MSDRLAAPTRRVKGAAEPAGRRRESERAAELAAEPIRSAGVGSVRGTIRAYLVGWLVGWLVVRSSWSGCVVTLFTSCCLCLVIDIGGGSCIVRGSSIRGGLTRERIT